MRAVAVAEGGSAENELTVQLDIVGACHQRRTCRDKMKGCDVKEPDPTFLEPRGAGTGVYTSGVRVSVVWFSCSTCMSTWRCARRRARGRESGSGSGLGWATSGRSVWIWKSTPRFRRNVVPPGETGNPNANPTDPCRPHLGRNCGLTYGPVSFAHSGVSARHASIGCRQAKHFLPQCAKFRQHPSVMRPTSLQLAWRYSDETVECGLTIWTSNEVTSLSNVRALWSISNACHYRLSSEETFVSVRETKFRQHPQMCHTIVETNFTTSI